MTKLSKQINDMQLIDKGFKQKSDEETNEYDFKQSLLASVEHPYPVSLFEIMHIAVDLG